MSKVSGKKYRYKLIRIDEETYNLLRDISMKTNLSMRDVVRVAVRYSPVFENLFNSDRVVFTGRIFVYATYRRSDGSVSKYYGISIPIEYEKVFSKLHGKEVDVVVYVPRGVDVVEGGKEAESEATASKQS